MFNLHRYGSYIPTLIALSSFPNIFWSLHATIICFNYLSSSENSTFAFGIAMVATQIHTYTWVFQYFVFSSPAVILDYNR